MTPDEALTVALRDIRLVGDAGLRLHYRKRAADALVRLRAQITRRDGRVDATGRTHEYRMRVRDAYEVAGYSRTEAKSEAAALRHHVSTAARAYFPELSDEYGLLPYDRNTYVRNKREAMKA